MKVKSINAPVVYGVAVSLSLLMALTGGSGWSMAGYVSLVSWVLLAAVHFELRGETWKKWRGELRDGVVIFKAKHKVDNSGESLPKDSVSVDVR